MKDVIRTLDMTNASKEDFIEVFQYLVGFSNNNRSYDGIADLYKIINNDLTPIRKTIDAYCHRLNIIFPDLDDVYKPEILPFDILHQNLQFLKNQVYYRNIDFDVVPLFDGWVDYKNQELKQVYQEIVKERLELINELPKDLSEEELQAKLNELSPIPNNLDYKTQLETFYGQLVELFKYKFNPRKIAEKLSFHAFVSAEMYGCLNEDLEPKVKNPLSISIIKSEDEEYIAQSHVQSVIEYVTLNDAYHYLKNKLSKEDLSKFEEYGVTGGLWEKHGMSFKNKTWTERGHYSAVERYRIADAKVNTTRLLGSQGLSTSTNNQNTRRISKKTLFFIGYRKVIYLTSKNEFGKIVEEILNYDKDIIHDSATKVEHIQRNGEQGYRYEWIDEYGEPVYAEILYLPRRYKVVCWDNEFYTDYGECKYQPLDLDKDLSFVKVTNEIKGKIFDNVNAEPISLIQRTLPLYSLYLILQHKRMEELAKYEGQIREVDLAEIPDDLVAPDEDGEQFAGGNKLAAQEYYRQVLGKAYVDPSSDKVGMYNAQRSSANKNIQTSSIIELINMSEALKLIEQEISMTMLITPQSKGQYQKYSKPTDNQAASHISSAMLESYFLEVDEVIRQLVEEFIYQTINKYKQFFSDNPDVKETYLWYMSSKGTRETISITPDLVNGETMGLVLKNSTASYQYRQYMLNTVQAFAQNRGEGIEDISNLVLGLFNGDSPSKIHSKIRDLSKQQKEQRQQFELQLKQIETQKSQIEAQEKQEERQFKYYKVDADNRARVEAATMNSLRNQEELDADKDGIPTNIEVLEKLRKLDQKDRELDIKEKESRINK